MLINCSNHPCAQWGAAQLEAAKKYGGVVDYAFPPVDPQWSEEQLARKATQIASRIAAMRPNAVLCQGEMGMTFTLVSMLMRQGIPVVHACSERHVKESQTPDGRTIKTSEFVFQHFRAYARE